MNNCSKVPHIAASILDDIEARLCTADFKQLTDKDLLSLHSVFGAALQRALEILEKYPVLTVYRTTKKTRELIEIKGDNDRCYRVFPRVNYCPCKAFKHQVIERKVQVACKHIVAARIALLLNKITIHEVTNDQYSMLLRSMYEFEET